MWVAPFGNLRVNGYLLLTAAYRSLSRPSSAPDAKAFPLRSFQLDLASGEIRSALFPRMAFALPENSAPLLCPTPSAKTCFRGVNGGRRTDSLNVRQRKLVLLRIMQAPKIVEIVIVTLAPFRMLFHN